LQQIGEGGMGVVFMAEQREPVRRRVALKIIKPGMDSTQVIARFEAERQALALMDHQNIARVLEAGTTDSGRPYFVMELINGVPITRYCDDNKLTPRQRLELFVPVCLAVQHAHQKGIIHRDLKPSNILVTLYDGQPVPKVIDFGVAKALEQRLTERTLFTQYGTIVGTFEYMAPEQAEMSALGVDTRSDVYSLGVLLYELLTGTTPLESGQLRTAALGEMLRLIREEEPPRPSTRLSSSGKALATISQRRNTEATKLAQMMRGELDWIVMKALEKERTRRYESASGLGRDVERYLADEPVEACPPSVRYRLGKFVRKHRAVLLAVSLFALLLLAGSAVSSWQALRATRAESVANDQRAIALRNEQTAQEKEALANQERTVATEASNRLLESREDLRRTLYYARSSLLQHAWVVNDMPRVLELLDQQRPGPGERDLRGFEWYYLDRQCHLDLLTLARPEGGADRTTTGISPDGRYAARGPGNYSWEKRIHGNIVIYDLNTGKEQSQLVMDANLFLYTLFWMPDSRRVGVIAGNGFNPNSLPPVRGEQLIVCDAATGREAYRLRSSDLPGFDPTHPLYFHGLPHTSGGGKYLVVGSTEVTSQRKDTLGVDRNGTLVVDPGSGKLLRRIKHGSDSWDHPLYSPEGQRLAFQPRDGLIRVIDLATGEPLWEASHQTSRPRLSWWSFTPDGGRLVGANRISQGSNTTNVSVQVWDAATGKELLALPSLSGEGVKEMIGRSWEECLAISPDGTRLASSVPDGEAREARIWDLATGQILQRWRDVPGTHLLRFSPDGKRLATAGQDSIVRIWELGGKRNESGTPPVLELRGHTASVNHILFHPDGTRLVTAAQDGTVKVWDMTARERTRLLRGQTFVPPIDLRDRAGLIVTLTGKLPRPGDTGDSTDAEQTAWDLNGHELHSVHHPVYRSRSGGEYRHALSPDGKLLARLWQGSEAELSVLEADTGKRIWSRKEDRPFRPDLSRTSRDRAFNISRLPEKVFDKDFVTNALFSRDGKRLAWGCNFRAPPQPGDLPEQIRGTGTVMILDTATGQELHRITCDGQIADFAFHPDGTRIATARTDGEVAVWDAATGTKALTLERVQGMSVGRGLVYSADGAWLTAVLVTGEPIPVKNAIGVWDAQTGKRRSVLAESGDSYSCFAFTPDVHRLATAAGTGEVKIWDTIRGHELLSLKDIWKKRIACLTFSPDGLRLCAVVGDSVWGRFFLTPVEVTLWDATPRRP
jgi:serine/threonine protein kinase/WD40 repeat protein